MQNNRYQQPQQRNDDYYGRQPQQQPLRKTPNRMAPNNNRYSSEMDEMDHPLKQPMQSQQRRQQQYRSQSYDNSNDEDEEDNQSDDDYHYQQQARRQTPAMGRQQQIQQKQSSMPPPNSNQPQERRECRYCGRKFAIDRIDKHEQICGKSHNKVMKVFDARKMRLRDTEAAQFASNIDKEPNSKPKTGAGGVPKYKIEHDKLMANIRAARQYTEYENKKAEGKAVGPPPQLPKYEIDDDDREQCPYCGRKFAADAAKRHIPVCERMNGGKVKAGMQTNSRRNGRR